MDPGNALGAMRGWAWESRVTLRFWLEKFRPHTREQHQFWGTTRSPGGACVNSMGAVLAGTVVMTCRHVDVTVQEGCTRCSFSRSVNERNEAWKGSGTGLRGIS